MMITHSHDQQQQMADDQMKHHKVETKKFKRKELNSMYLTELKQLHKN